MTSRSSTKRPARSGIVTRVVVMARLALPVLAAAPGPVSGQSDALAAFGARMIGTWEAADSRHVFEWGVGARVVKSSSYFPRNGEWELVSEGIWFWDPSIESVRGITVAVGMPVELFEYTSTVGTNELIHDLVSHGEMGGTYVERWRFTDDGYDWTLEQDGERLMGGTYRRVR